MNYEFWKKKQNALKVWKNFANKKNCSCSLCKSIYPSVQKTIEITPEHPQYDDL